MGMWGLRDSIPAFWMTHRAVNKNIQAALGYRWTNKSTHHRMKSVPKGATCGSKGRVIQFVSPCLIALAMASVVPPTVRLPETETLITGSQQTVSGNLLDVYLSIPYAQPPTGERRFKDPEPITNLPPQINATQFPPSCCQINFEPLDHVNKIMSEDCLYLNIWTPSQKSHMSVLIFIYGGSFEFGSTDELMNNPQYLAARTDMVIVTMNYRVGAFGFIDLKIEGADEDFNKTNIILNKDILIGITKDERLISIDAKSLFYRNFGPSRSSEFIKIINYYLREHDYNNYGKAFKEIVEDYYFRCPTFYFSNVMASKNNSVYFYYFTYQSEHKAKDENTRLPGAAHNEDLQYTMGLPQRDSINYTLKEIEFSNTMMDYIGNFSKYGMKSVPKGATCGSKAYGDAVLSRRRVFEWYKRFKEGREETADNERSERPSTSTMTEKVDKVLELVREDRRITVRENARKEAASLNLEATTDDPKFLKRVITGDETWIYCFDSETTQQTSEWRFKNEPRPKKARKALSKVKVMLTVLFDYQGIVHHEFQQQGSSKTADS
ncbi:hypothetical protein LAZ67_16001006 [Cordylochernes scorpioides]|uniref:Carboxylesterase type B domain-containing protein n=1 Tax=Cordylochernes scorpioides TaxID=51811 RepID=A0ABY6LAZ5_9ARAC|nr:hypothetical protein LAZ67_16001006 [Cordylochernes scorpioides]